MLSTHCTVTVAYYGLQDIDDTVAYYGLQDIDDTVAYYGLQDIDDTVAYYGLQDTDDTVAYYGLQDTDDTENLDILLLLQGRGVLRSPLTIRIGTLLLFSNCRFPSKHCDRRANRLL